MSRHEELAVRHMLTIEQAYRIYALVGNDDEKAEYAARVVDEAGRFDLVEAALLMGIDPLAGRSVNDFAAAYIGWLTECQKTSIVKIGEVMKQLAIGIKSEAEHVEKAWGFWSDLLVDPDGTLNLAKVKLELYDYLVLLRAVPKVYAHITGDRISKPTTDPDVVIRVADEHYQEVLCEDDEETSDDDEEP